MINMKPHVESIMDPPQIEDKPDRCDKKSYER